MTPRARSRARCVTGNYLAVVDFTISRVQGDEEGTALAAFGLITLGLGKAAAVAAEGAEDVKRMANAAAVNDVTKSGDTAQASITMSAAGQSEDFTVEMAKNDGGRWCGTGI